MPNASLYHKGKLVVGGETMPFVQLLKPWLGDWALELGGTSGTLGISSDRKVFENGTGMKLGPIICWENEFSDYTTGHIKQGKLSYSHQRRLVGRYHGHVQHMRFSGLRAIETVSGSCEAQIRASAVLSTKKAECMSRWVGKRKA